MIWGRFVEKGFSLEKVFHWKRFFIGKGFPWEIRCVYIYTLTYLKADVIRSQNELSVMSNFITSVLRSRAYVKIVMVFSPK